MTADIGSKIGPNRAQACLLRLVRRSFLRRRLLRRRMGSLVRRLGPGTIDTTFRGARFRVHLGDNLTERNLLIDPFTERHELDFIIAHTPQNGVFVDLGANIGMYALVVARTLGPGGRVIAVEPDTLIRERLEANIALSQCRSITVVPAAVGDRECEVEFSRNERNLGESHVGGESGMTVHMNTLSGLLAAESVSRIDSLKIDIEGYEDRALLPYFQSTPVEYWPAAIVIEHAHPEGWNKDCLSELARLGYKVVRRIGLNTLLERTPAVCAASREQVASIPGDDGTS